MLAGLPEKNPRGLRDNVTRRGANKEMSLLGWVFQDWAVNDGYRDSQLILGCFGWLSGPILGWLPSSPLQRLLSAVHLPLLGNRNPRRMHSGPASAHFPSA